MRNSLFDTLRSFTRSRRVKLSPREYLIYGGLGLLLLLLVVSYGPEIRYYQRTLQAGKLMGYSVIGGAVLGVLLGFAFRQMLERRQGRRLAALERMQAHIVAFLLCVFFAPLFGSWLNRLPAPRQPQWETFIFFEEQPHASSRYGYLEGEQIEPDGYYLYVIREEKLYRFDLPRPVAKGLAKGSELSLPLRKGLLGFDVLDVEALLPDNQ